MQSPIRILVVDDHPVVRTGLQGMLASQPDFAIVGEASNGIEALQQAAVLHPNVVLMDLRMPEMDGVAAIDQLNTTLPNVRVLVLTTYDSDSDIVRAIEAGAIGYLLKDAPREELFKAIRAAARGESVLAPTIASRLMGRMRAAATPLETLSEREIEVLTLVSRGASNKEIARSLYLSEATVKTHLLHIFSKLSVSDRTSAVTEGVRRGFISI